MFKIFSWLCFLVLGCIFLGCIKASEDFHYARINRVGKTAQRSQKEIENNQKRIHEINVQLQGILNSMHKTTEAAKQKAFLCEALLKKN